MMFVGPNLTDMHLRDPTKCDNSLDVHACKTGQLSRLFQDRSLGTNDWSGKQNKHAHKKKK
jgi:hypothetical protein